MQYLAGETAVCGGSHDCFKVLGSVYSHIGRIPVAALGALGYFSAFSFATFAALAGFLAVVPIGALERFDAARFFTFCFRSTMARKNITQAAHALSPGQFLHGPG